MRIIKNGEVLNNGGTLYFNIANISGNNKIENSLGSPTMLETLEKNGIKNPFLFFKKDDKGGLAGAWISINALFVQEIENFIYQLLTKDEFLKVLFVVSEARASQHR